MPLSASVTSALQPAFNEFAMNSMASAHWRSAYSLTLSYPATHSSSSSLSLSLSISLSHTHTHTLNQRTNRPKTKVVRVMMAPSCLLLYSSPMTLHIRFNVSLLNSWPALFPCLNRHFFPNKKTLFCATSNLLPYFINLIMFEETSDHDS